MSNHLDVNDDVKVEIFNTNGDKVSAWKGSGMRNISAAVHAAFEEQMHPESDIKAYVFRVSDLTSGTSARYRVDAGGEVRLIV